MNDDDIGGIGEPGVGGAGAVQEQAAQIAIGAASLQGDLVVPVPARGVVLFAHGSGSSRFSRRNRAVAHALRTAGWATLLIDLLTPDEEALDDETAQLRFDIRLLAERLEASIAWLQRNRLTHSLAIGLFGASTGAAAALVAAAKVPEAVRAVVSRGGRPDLAADALFHVNAPTLLIVGANDTGVIELNRQAFAMLPGIKRLDIIPGATHLFEEPGALEQVSRLAEGWFSDHLLG